MGLRYKASSVQGGVTARVGAAPGRLARPGAYGLSSPRPHRRRHHRISPRAKPSSYISKDSTPYVAHCLGGPWCLWCRTPPTCTARAVRLLIDRTRAVPVVMAGRMHMGADILPTPPLMPPILLPGPFSFRFWLGMFLGARASRPLRKQARRLRSQGNLVRFFLKLDN